MPKVQLGFNLSNWLKRNPLAANKCLMPLFEAISNSLHAIEEGAPSQPKIAIAVQREAGLTEGWGRIEGFQVLDNGVGFTPENQRSFETSYSDYKDRRGGKGIGRLLWLKAFNEVHIESHYRQNGQMLKLKLLFTEKDGVDKTEHDVPSAEIEPWTRVSLVGFLEKYREQCPQQLELLANRVIEHHLMEFLSDRCPQIEIQDPAVGEIVRVNHTFETNFEQHRVQRPIKVGNQDFTATGLKLFINNVKDHRLVFTAHGREVERENLAQMVPNLKSRLENEDGAAFHYHLYVSGDFLDENVNDDRTEFRMKRDPDPDAPLVEEPTFAEIRTAAVQTVREELDKYFSEVNKSKEAQVQEFVDNHAPQYKPLIRELDVDAMPPNLDNKGLDLYLHERYYERDKRVRLEVQTILSQPGEEGPDYEEKVRKAVEATSEMGAAQLAKYVMQRRVIIDLLEKNLETTEAGKYSREAVIHKLIFPRYKTSEDIPYNSHNLWLVDERLSYHRFLTSDIPLTSVPQLENDSLTRPDIMAFFDHKFTFGEGETQSPSAIVVLEFKRPGATPKPDESPMRQVTRTVSDIKSGQVKEKGRPILIGRNAPAYGYVICDFTEALQKECLDLGYKPTPDGLGFYSFNDNWNLYTEVISYNKLLLDAKKRHRAFFEKLGISTV